MLESVPIMLESAPIGLECSLSESEYSSKHFNTEIPLNI